MRALHGAAGRPLGIDCVVPAAGLASRMAGEKLSCDFRGRPLVTHAVANALAACRRVIVVAGHDAEAVRASLAAPILADAIENTEPGSPAIRNADRLAIVENPDYQHGMITSIARGAIEVESTFFFVAPADMPFLRPTIFRQIAVTAGIVQDAAGRGASGETPGAREITASGTSGEVAAWLPAHRGRPCHPVLIRSSLRRALSEYVRGAAAKDPAGKLPSMRRFLADYSTMQVPVDDVRASIDIDTEEEFRRYARDTGGEES